MLTTQLDVEAQFHGIMMWDPENRLFGPF